MGAPTECPILISRKGGTSLSEIGTLITNLINFLKWLSGGVGIIMLIIGAIMHQTSRSPGSMENAKSVMTGAMIGLAIALLAQVIVSLLKSWLPS
jgi:vacuolar-type H+-ATPase subunit I/STV1